MSEEFKQLKRLLPHGAITAIAKKLGISQPSVSAALRGGKPSHPAVREAMRMAEESGALDVAQQLAKLTIVAQAA